jgi:hypothetical protein
VLAKNLAHGITASSTVLVASSLGFDPCFSDVVASYQAGATLALPWPAAGNSLTENMAGLIATYGVTHVLTTPTVWGMCRLPNDGATPLEVVALGGESIPRAVVDEWARDSASASSTGSRAAVRLMATYGVTEACVYQTIREVTIPLTQSPHGNPCGPPLPGNVVKISEDGEVLLSGSQVDAISGYYGDAALTASKFVSEDAAVRWYKTGDIGTLIDGELWLKGRKDSQVKLNGVRIELTETPCKIMSSLGGVVKRCWQTVDDNRLVLYVYTDTPPPDDHIVPPRLPLHTLLSSFAEENNKPGTSPSLYVSLAMVKVGATGKVALPKVSKLSLPPSTETTLVDSVPKSTLARALTESVKDVLNLSSSQLSHLTPTSTLAHLGTDSLTATRIIRQTYALYRNVRDSRHLQGQFGNFDEPWWQAKELMGREVGDWVAFVESSEGPRDDDPKGTAVDSSTSAVTTSASSGITVATAEMTKSPSERLFAALVAAISSSQSSVAAALLEVMNVDPNLNAHDGRIGKVSDRRERKAQWSQTPLHLAAMRADLRVLAALLPRTKNWMSPDASAAFPIHNVCLGIGAEELRWDCLQLFLTRVPLTVRDGSKQTLLHAAARSGKTLLLERLIEEWMRPGQKKPPSLDERDRWQRTCVHWAVLNSHLPTLAILLERGASPAPFWRGASKDSRTSAAIETPMELALRIHGPGDGTNEYARLLQDAMAAMDSEDKKRKI